MNLLRNLVRKGDEASINGKVILVLRVCDIIVEIYYFLQEHKDVISFQLLITRDRDVLVVLTWRGLIDLNPSMQEGKLTDLHPFFDVVKVWHKSIAYVGNYVVLEVVDHRTVLDVSHFIVDHFNCVDKRLQKIKFEKVRLEIGQILTEL